MKLIFIETPKPECMNFPIIHKILRNNLLETNHTTTGLAEIEEYYQLGFIDSACYHEFCVDIYLQEYKQIHILFNAMCNTCPRIMDCPTVEIFTIGGVHTERSPIDESPSPIVVPQIGDCNPTTDEMHITTSSIDAVTIFSYFLFNFPHKWVNDCFNNKHLTSKYKNALNDYVNSATATLKFFMELSTNNQSTMIDWILNNYKR